ncbi:MAG: tetratricopeptide repeat protein [Thermoanaerobaculia bacterium]
MAVPRDKIIANAEKLVTKGKVEQAIKEYERLLADNPSDVNTLNRIGDLWVRINRTDEAVKVFGQIADRYAIDGFFLKAIAIYKKVNKLDPSRLQIYSQLADLYAKQGLAMEAKGQYQVLADYYQKHGDAANALATYRKIAELDPNSLNVHVKLADLYSQNNQTADALREYDRVGKMLLKRGQLNEALVVFQKALKIDPGNVDLAESLVASLIDARDFDNAISLLQSTLEANKQNPRLVALLGKTHLGKGDLATAKRVLEQGLSSNPTDPSLRENLAELALREGSPDEALNVLGPLADSLAARGDATAADFLNKIIRIEPLHTPTLARLVDINKQLRRETHVISALTSLAEAHIAVSELHDAISVLEELVRKEPQNSQHQEKLGFVRRKLGIDTPVAPSPAKTAPVAAIPEPEEVEEAVEEISFGEPEAPEVEIELGEPEEISIDMEGPGDLDFGIPVESELGMPEIEPVPEPAPEVDEDLDFITEHMTEAEVFAKYGLAEKAIEHLSLVLNRNPRHAEANERLLRIYLDESQKPQATDIAMQLLSIHQEDGNDEAFDRIFNDLVARGFMVDPGPPVLVEQGPDVPAGTAISRPAPVARAKPASAPPPVAAPEPVVAEPEEITLDFEEATEAPSLDFGAAEEDTTIDFEVEAPAEELVEEVSLAEEPAAIDEISFDLTPPVEESAVELPPLAEEPVLEMPDFGSEEPVLEMAIPEEPVETISFDEPSAGLGFEDLAAEPPATEEPAIEFPSAEEPAIELPPLEEPAIEIPPAEEPTFEIPPIEAEALLEDAALEQPALEEISFDEEPAAAASELELELPVAAETEVGTPAVEELGEVDFYIEQELFDEARTKLDALMAQYPDNDELLDRKGRLDAATAPPEAMAPPPKLAPQFSAKDIEDELLSAIPDDDEDIEIYPPAAAAAAPPPPIDEGDLFAEEDDFFDLASELENELLADDEQVSLADEEQSLEDIFREFKKGVEQQLDSEDYDTHYNLGIAYKEMGLIDEAIGEFQLASKDPKRMIECCSMLGLCFLEKGMPQLAVKWYKKGLESPEITEDEHLGLLYDLGSAHLEIGDIANAQKAFLEVYGVNTGYRDVINKIKQIEEAKK